MTIGIPRSGANLGPRLSYDFSTGGRTKQSMADECDINLIMAKYIKTGAVEHGNKFAGEYGFATSIDFHDAMNLITKGESMFAELPAAIRGRFNNDTAYFLDFVQDPKNVDEMVELGLAEPRAPEPGSPAVVAEELPAGPPEAEEEPVATPEAP